MSDSALVHARLGRRPQDMLEAAVVLEAWAGVPAQRALETGAAMMPRPALEPQPSAAVLPPVERSTAQLVEGVAFVASVLAIAFWAAPLASALGADAVTRALTVALPLTLALQWALRSRYLSRPHAIAELAGVRAGLGCAAVAAVALPWPALGRAGAVAGLLTVTWTGGAILMRGGRAAAYAAIVLGATAPMAAGVAPLPVLAATAALTAAAVAVELRGSARVPVRGRHGRAAICALLGAGLGVLLVADRSVGWGAGAAPALALLPSALAGVWAGLCLGRLGHAIPRALAGIPAAPRGAAENRMPLGDESPRATAGSPAHRTPLGHESPRATAGSPVNRAPLRVFAGAVARLLGASAAGSLALALIVPVGAGVLAAFALLALTTLLVGLLETIGRVGWAAAGVGCAVAAELAVRDAPFPGAGLALGAAVGALVLLPAVVAPLLRPARTLATTLWIP
jgi:hypothetical protein